MLKTRNLEPKNWSLFDIVGIYSIGTNLTLKVGLAPMETTFWHLKCLVFLAFIILILVIKMLCFVVLNAKSVLYNWYLETGI